MQVNRIKEGQELDAATQQEEYAACMVLELSYDGNQLWGSMCLV